MTDVCWSCDAHHELDLYHLDLPVDVPLLHVAEAPGFDGISSAGIHPDQPVVGDADQLLALPALEPVEKRNDALTVMKMTGVSGKSFSSHLLGKEMSDSKLGQRLPGLDETHLCFDETHLGHILVGFKDPG